MLGTSATSPTAISGDELFSPRLFISTLDEQFAASSARVLARRFGGR
jgi:hypothetical protein